MSEEVSKFEIPLSLAFPRLAIMIRLVVSAANEKPLRERVREGLFVSYI